MTRFAALLLLVFLVAGCATQLSAVQRAHQVALRLEIGKGICSGTAIGPHAILSASHCFADGHDLAIDGKPVVVTGEISDGHDHTILFVDRTFTEYATISQAPAQGDEVFILGNPAVLRDIYRHGYVAGRLKNGQYRVTMYDMQDFFGDSGSGIFDAQGRLVGVLSSVLAFYEDGARVQFAASFDLAFTPQQWAQAGRVDVAMASP